MLPGCKHSFPFRTGVINLDHGGFGVMARDVREMQLKMLAWVESFPPRAFFDEDDSDSYRTVWKKTSALVAERFGAHAEDLALISNVTDGVNALLQSLSFEPGDEILIGSLAYGAVVNAIETITGKQGVRLTKIPFTFPEARAEQCLLSLKQSLTPQTKLVVLDHLTSGTALVMPVAEMIQVCHDHETPVLIDGAHAPGNIPLHLESLNADWYVANLHKWYFVPRSCGFLWARHDRQAHLRSAIISWNIHEPFPRSFEWTGTRDPSAFLSIPAAFEFMDRFGEANVIRHNHALVMEGRALLAKTWGVSVDTPQSMTANMTLVPLPDRLPFPVTMDGRKQIQGVLWQNHQIACPCILHEDRLYLRISAQIYNEIKDYEQLGEAIQTLGI